MAFNSRQRNYAGYLKRLSAYPTAECQERLDRGSLRLVIREVRRQFVTVHMQVVLGHRPWCGSPISKITPLRSWTNGSNRVWRAGWSKRGETRWVEETEPSLVPCARPLAWFRGHAPTSVITRVAAM